MGRGFAGAGLAATDKVRRASAQSSSRHDGRTTIRSDRKHRCNGRTSDDHPPDPVHRRGDAGRRPRHLAGVRCRRRRAARRPLREVLQALRRRRADDRHLADVRPRRSVRRHRRRSGLRPRVFLATKVWTSGRERGDRADAALGQPDGSAERRPDADPQPRRLAAPTWRRCAT